MRASRGQGRLPTSCKRTSTIIDSPHQVLSTMFQEFEKTPNRPLHWDRRGTDRIDLNSVHEIRLSAKCPVDGIAFDSL